MNNELQNAEILIIICVDIEWRIHSIFPVISCDSNKKMEENQK